MADYVRAEDGKVWDGDGHWTDLDACHNYAVALMAAVQVAIKQREDIVHACAQGHVWSAGINTMRGDDKAIFRTCVRPGCEADDEQIGEWLPFEPKDHGTWYTLDNKAVTPACTGPGCSYCMSEQAYQIPNIQIDRGGIRFPISDAERDAFRQAQP